MKALLITLVIGFMIAAFGTTTILVAKLKQTHDLTKTNQALDEELAALKSQMAEVRQEQTETTAKLARALSEATGLSNRIQELEAVSTDQVASDAAPAVPRSYQTKAWLGRELIGWAWIVPQNVKVDSETGRAQYEPVIWIDDKLRNKFVSYVTNVVEREIPTSYTTVNNRYYPYPTYYSYGGWSHGGGRWPSQNSQPSAPSASPFDPGTGGLPASQIGTPAGKITTRPQVLGTPAGRIKTRPSAELVADE